MVKIFVINGHLKVRTALLMGQPMTKEVVGSRVTSDTSEMQVDTQTSERGTCEHGHTLEVRLS